ncbi:hypothetical protein [Faecalibacillus intestinalis]|uniref:hypothetical protein n=2 Tax=Faecalibacillus intestinalis TaxID=1982626 RepID=UPI0035215BB0
MKCKYCGVEIGNSLECHLCGHKQIGKTTCPVCSKLIYPYQEYCSNCGSPTIYRKSEPIKKVTPDTSVHSEASHNYHTVSESYDYKKNAYDYKKPFKDLNKYVPIQKNKKTFNHPNVRKNKRIVKIIIGIIVAFNLIIPIAGAIIGFIGDSLETDETTSSFDGNGNTDLSSFNLSQDSSRGDYNQNFTNSDGGAFVYQNKLYISLNGQLIKYDAHFENSEVLEESSCDHIYVDDRGCFYENDSDFIFLDFNGKRKTLLNEVSHCYVLDQKIFYIKDETLYCLTIDENMNEIDNKKMVDDTYEFNVDDQNQHILYTNNDYESKLIDFNGTSLKKNVDNYGNAYFIDGFLYYREYDGIYKTDFSSDEGELVQAASDIYRFGVGQDEENEKVIVYGENYDNVLNAYFDDDIYALYDDARDFYIIGDKVIFFTYDDHYTRHYFISSYDGEYAPFEE